LHRPPEERNGQRCASWIDEKKKGERRGGKERTMLVPHGGRGGVD